MVKNKKISRTFLPILLIILIGVLALIVENESLDLEKKDKEMIVYEIAKSPDICFTLTDNCEEFLLNYLENRTTKCAFYDLTLTDLIDHLILNDVPTIIEDSNYEGNFMTHKSNALMHNKFCFDNTSVITGSMNPTNNGAFRNNNNLIIIYSEYLAKNYAEEFNEFNQGIHGKGELVDYPMVVLNNKTIIKNYFCPEDKCEEKVLRELKQANKSIYFMTFSFTSDGIGDYLISKKDILDIKGVFDSQQTSSYSEYHKMIDNNMSIKKDSNKYKLHHKVFIIDNSTVITGSYNPTKNADTRNDENLLIIKDNEIAKKYLSEFEKIWS